MSLELKHHYSYSKSGDDYEVLVNNFRIGIIINNAKYVSNKIEVPTAFKPETANDLRSVYFYPEAANGSMNVSPTVTNGYENFQILAEVGTGSGTTSNVYQAVIGSSAEQRPVFWYYDGTSSSTELKVAVRQITLEDSHVYFFPKKAIVFPSGAGSNLVLTKLITIPTKYTKSAYGYDVIYTTYKVSYRLSSVFDYPNYKVQINLTYAIVGTSNGTISDANFALIDMDNQLTHCDTYPTYNHDEIDALQLIMTNTAVQSQYFMNLSYKKAVDQIIATQDDITNNVKPAITANAEDIEAIKEDIGSSDLASTFVAL